MGSKKTPRADQSKRLMYETINQIQKNRPTLKQYIKDRVPTAGKTRKLLSEVFEYNNYKFRETKKDYFDKLQAAY